MPRSPAVNRGVVLPAPLERYDVTNERETRRLIEDALRQSQQYAALTNAPPSVTAIGGLTGEANTVPYFTSVSAMALAALTPYARTILACAAASDARTALGLGDVAVIDLSGNASEFLDGSGNWSTPAGGGTSAPGSYPSLSTGIGVRISAELSTVTAEPDARITQINDLSGNGRHFTQTSGARARPRLIPGGTFYRRPALVFDGSNSTLAMNATWTLAQPFTVVVVFHNWSIGGGNSHLFRDSNNGPVVFLSGNTDWAMNAGSTITSSALFQQNTDATPNAGVGSGTTGGGPGTSAPAILMAVFNGASSLLSNNGVEVTGNAGTTGLSGTLSIAAPTSNRPRLGLYEFVVFTGALSPTERAALNTYYADLMGITL